MAKQTEKVEGIVKNLRKDGIGLQLETGEWYSNKFFKGKLDCEKGDKVEVSYSINGEYTNLEACKILQKGEKKAIQKEIREDVNASQLTSYAKDLVVALIGEQPIPNENSKKTLEIFMNEAAIAVAKAYLTIKREVMQPQVQEQATQTSKEENQEDY